VLALWRSDGSLPVSICRPPVGFSPDRSLVAFSRVFIIFTAAAHHRYQVVVIPRFWKRVIERLNGKRTQMNGNALTGQLICGALVILAFFITQPIIPLAWLTRDSLAIALAIILIGFFTMIARKKAVTQVIGFLVMENGLFLGAAAAAYGMPLIVELGVFFDVLVVPSSASSHRMQDTRQRGYEQAPTLKE
jgi:hydrogenase-4 component E